MTNKSRQIGVSTPGRVCLFGEHQDYLGLPVISCAISLRLAIEGVTTAEPVIDIDLPDIGSHESFMLGRFSVSHTSRDYLRSAVNVLQRHGFTFSCGFRGGVRGRIPINAGTSSSSALVVSWVRLLARISDQEVNLAPEDCARLAHEAEVVEFGEPGGMMDHFSTAFGGILAIDFNPVVNVQRLAPSLGTFVLGNSREPKDTHKVLARVRGGVRAIIDKLTDTDAGFSLLRTRTAMLDKYSALLTREERQLLAGTVRNHELTLEARSLLGSRLPDHQVIGSLLLEEQGILRDVLGISTTRIDRMIEAALHAGAPGGKINGSGGGGCMFVYAPDNAEIIAEAITREGGEASIVNADRGTEIEATDL
jgi:galactokinase